MEADGVAGAVHEEGDARQVTNIFKNTESKQERQKIREYNRDACRDSLHDAKNNF